MADGHAVNVLAGALKTGHGVFWAALTRKCCSLKVHCLAPYEAPNRHERTGVFGLRRDCSQRLPSGPNES